MSEANGRTHTWRRREMNASEIRFGSSTLRWIARSIAYSCELRVIYWVKWCANSVDNNDDDDVIPEWNLLK